MFASLAHRIELLGADWARKRQGHDPASGVTLSRFRIYILPTRHGAGFAMVVFAMLLGSINYGTSLGYGLTFLMSGLALVVMNHCNCNLLSLNLRFVGATPVFAGQPARFRIAVRNDGTLDRQDVEFAIAKTTVRPIDVAAAETATVELVVPTKQRGWLALGRFTVATEFPANLFRSWTWVHMQARCLVYPAPAINAPAMPELADGDESGTRKAQGDADFYGFRNATASDSPRRIAWKAFARNDQLLAKQFAGGQPKPRWIDWDMLPGLDTERRISLLARWCVDAAEQARSFGLRLPGKTVPVGSGREQLHKCLSELALFDPGPAQ